jgi:hypothetical protein
MKFLQKLLGITTTRSRRKSGNEYFQQAVVREGREQLKALKKKGLRIPVVLL